MLQSFTAPFSRTQIDQLAAWQKENHGKPYNCPRQGGPGHPTVVGLVPGTAGWHCPHCDFTDTTAYNFMLGEPMNPLEPVRPVLSRIEPPELPARDPVDVVVSFIGENFDENSVIHFAGHDEPTTLVSPTEVTTIVKPSLFDPATVAVTIRQPSPDHEPGDPIPESNELFFVFTASEAPSGASCVKQKGAKQ